MVKGKRKLYWTKNEYKNKLEICVRAVIKSENKILVCWHKLKKYYFFPGGHIDFGETAESAIVRELKEELNLKVKKLSFIGIVENIYKDKYDKDKHHEINLVFNIIVEKVEDKSLEDHIDFVFMDDERFSQEKIMPLALKKAIIYWLKNKKIFWVSHDFQAVRA